MSTNESEKVDCIERRTKRALDEYMTVLPEFGRAEDADGLFTVVGENGNTYLADTQMTSCECDDDKYNLDDREPCKHVRRARIATGDRPVPARAIGDGDHQVTVNNNFGFRVDASAKIVAPDGGVIDGETGELLEDGSEDVAESVWSDPQVEVDKYGKPTGDHYVRCEECGVEVLTALTDCASHREGCSHSM